MSHASQHNSSLTNQQIQAAALVASKIAAEATSSGGGACGKDARGVMMERTFHMNITNTLSNLALAGPHGGFWKLVDGKQPELLANMDHENLDACAATSQLNNAVIHEVTLLEHQSTFPIPLGVTINCVPSREITDIGEKYAYTVLPNGLSSNPQVIYKAEPLSDDMYDWHKQFPQYNASNLETEGILPVNNQPFVFIESGHPVLAVLRSNPELIGCDLDQQKKMGDYHRISRQLLQTCCNAIRQKILSKISSHDLNTLSVQLHRINAESWEDLGDGTMAMRNLKLKATMSPEEEEEAKRKHLRKFANTPYSYLARIKIKYELPNMMAHAIPTSDFDMRNSVAVTRPLQTGEHHLRRRISRPPVSEASVREQQARLDKMMKRMMERNALKSTEASSSTRQDSDISDIWDQSKDWVSDPNAPVLVDIYAVPKD